MSISRTDKKLAVCCFVNFLIIGMLSLSIGSLLPYIRDEKGLAYSAIGLLVSIHSIGKFTTSFFYGYVSEMLGRKRSAILFTLFFPIAYLIIVFSSSFWLIAIGFFLSGIVRGTTTNFCNSAVNGIPSGNAVLINAMHGIFAAGAIVFPLLLSILTKTNAANWRYACFIMAGAGVISVIAYAIMPETKVKTKEKVLSKNQYGFFREPLFWLITSVLFFYQCVEQGFVGWMITYFEDTGLLGDKFSQISASLLWVMILIGRIAATYFSTRVSKYKMMLYMGSGLLIFFIIMMMSKSAPVILIGVLCFGLSMAGIYPTAVSCVGDLEKRFPLSWSYILSIGSTGAILMPGIIGKVADAKGIAMGMGTIVIAIIVDLISFVLLKIYSGRMEKN